MNPHITRIDLSSNRLTCLPPDCEESDDETDDRETRFQPVQWACSSLKVLKVAHNEIEELPHAIYGAVELEKLLLSKNKLSAFDMAWKCPLVSLMTLSITYHADISKI